MSSDHWKVDDASGARMCMDCTFRDDGLRSCPTSCGCFACGVVGPIPGQGDALWVCNRCSCHYLHLSNDACREKGRKTAAGVAACPACDAVIKEEPKAEEDAQLRLLAPNAGRVSQKQGIDAFELVFRSDPRQPAAPLHRRLLHSSTTLLQKHDGDPPGSAWANAETVKGVLQAHGLEVHSASAANTDGGVSADEHAVTLTGWRPPPPVDETAPSVREAVRKLLGQFDSLRQTRAKRQSKAPPKVVRRPGPVAQRRKAKREAHEAAQKMDQTEEEGDDDVPLIVALGVNTHSDGDDDRRSSSSLSSAATSSSSTSTSSGSTVKKRGRRKQPQRHGSSSANAKRGSGTKGLLPAASKDTAAAKARGKDTTTITPSALFGSSTGAATTGESPTDAPAGGTASFAARRAARIAANRERLKTL